MDFHRNGKEGFKQPFELDLFMSSPEKWSRLGFNLKTIQKLAQEFYEGELKEYIEANENCVVYDKPWATKEKKIRIWDPVNEQYEIIILRTYKVGKKDPTAKRKKVFTFTGTLVSSYGKYLKMDVLILIAYVSRTLVHKKNKESLSNLLLHYNLSPGTFRKWAKDFLLMTETDYVPGMNIWEACYKSLDRLTSSDQFRDFYKKHMEGVSKGTFASYKK